jgi:hypothetical protein
VAAFVQHVRVDHGGADVLVTEQFLQLKQGQAPARPEPVPAITSLTVLQIFRLGDID